MVSGEFDQGAVLFGPIADMQWPVWAIEIETIKRGVLRQPKGYLIAVFPLVYQINRGPLPRTDNSSSLIEFTGRMLIEPWSDAWRLIGQNGPAQLSAAKTIGEPQCCSDKHIFD
ncbi:hypothetical protein ACEUCT_05555 [Aeromonas caviae]|uniref:hypothetical protein n=1 Tax=Aeromonas caviae TaxID=648 RepID=UPI0038CFD821